MAIALVWGISVFLWTGDLKSAEAYADMLIARAESHSMTPYLLVGRGFKGEIIVRRGDAVAGLDELRSSLQMLHAAPYELLTTPLNLSLVRGLTAIGHIDEALALIEEALGRVEENGDLLYKPELLRMKEKLLLQSPERDRGEARICLLQALDLSRSQRARAWELRIATDLAALMVEQGEIDNARKFLQPAVAHFTEGLETEDLKTAKHLLATLG